MPIGIPKHPEEARKKMSLSHIGKILSEEHKHNISLGCANAKRKPTSERFWSKVEKKSDNECWEWRSSKTRGGYGCFRVNNKQVHAHRYSWELHFGLVLDGLCVLHHCDNPSCVNPTHLWLGTKYDNIQDMIRKGRNKVGSQRLSSKLTEQDVICIRNLHKKEIPMKELARIYNVSYVSIAKICSRCTWKHV